MKIDAITPTASVALADKARHLIRQNIPVVKLQTGDPDFSTHPAIIEAAHRALKEGHTHYSFASGLPELREALAQSVREEIREEKINSNFVLVTHGAAEGIYATFAALLEHNDDVIILEPNWPTVASLVTLLGGNPIKVSYLQEDDAIIECLNKLRTPRTKILCFNTPNNPTGMVLSERLLKRLVDWAAHFGIYVLADEVYRSLSFGLHQSSVLPWLLAYDKIIFVDSFSKKYAMAGWRIGYIIASPKIIELIGKSSQLTITHVAPFVQYGALEALRNKEVAQYVQTMKQGYLERRNQGIAICGRLGLTVLPPDGAFYLFIHLGVGVDDSAFAATLLEKARVCVVPGSAYGEAGRGYIRVTYAAPISDLILGLEKIGEHCLSDTFLHNYTSVENKEVKQ